MEIPLLKDILIIRGRNYYPSDLEAAASECHEALRPNCAAAFTVELDGEGRLVIAQADPALSLDPREAQVVRGVPRLLAFGAQAVISVKRDWLHRTQCEIKLHVALARLKVNGIAR